MSVNRANTKSVKCANILAAIRDIDLALRSGQALPITRERLEELNFQILAGIPDAPEVIRVSCASTTSPPANTWPRVGRTCPTWSTVSCSGSSELRSGVSPESPVRERFINAVLAAVLAHLYIAWIHPFGNGNGRLARLIEVQIFSESGVVPTVATNLLSDFYNKTRDHGYYRGLDAPASAYLREDRRKDAHP